MSTNGAADGGLVGSSDGLDVGRRKGAVVTGAGVFGARVEGSNVGLGVGEVNMIICSTLITGRPILCISSVTFVVLELT
jgi:hypothetical protein